MKRYTTRQARQNLAELLQAARDGEEILITSRDQIPIRLVPESPSPLARFRVWKARAVELDEDPLEDVRRGAEGRKVKL
jgi:prevent-host-death family protein